MANCHRRRGRNIIPKLSCPAGVDPESLGCFVADSPRNDDKLVSLRSRIYLAINPSHVNIWSSLRLAPLRGEEKWATLALLASPGVKLDMKQDLARNKSMAR